MSNPIPESFGYELKQPFTFMTNNVEQSCTHIKVNPPSHKQKDDVIFLTQAVTKSIFELRKSMLDPETESSAGEEASNSDEKGRQMLVVLYASSVDVRQIIKVFKRLLLTQGTTLMPMDVPPIERHYNLISIDDEQTLLGEYLVNFIASSVSPDL